MNRIGSPLVFLILILVVTIPSIQHKRHFAGFGGVGRKTVHIPLDRQILGVVGIAGKSVPRLHAKIFCTASGRLPEGAILEIVAFHGNRMIGFIAAEAKKPNSQKHYRQLRLQTAYLLMKLICTLKHGIVRKKLMLPIATLPIFRLSQID